MADTTGKATGNFISNVFSQIPVRDMIQGSLGAFAEIDKELTMNTVHYIETIGIRGKDGDDKGGEGVGEVRMVNAPITREFNGQTASATISAPFLCLAPPKNKTCNGEFSLTAKVTIVDKESSSLDAGASLEASGQAGWGPFSVKASIKGSVSRKSSSDHAASTEATVDIKGSIQDLPQSPGLLRFMDNLEQTSNALGASLQSGNDDPSGGTPDPQKSAPSGGQPQKKAA